MTEHLPECPWAPHDCDDNLCERCDRGCYCNELRACEQRVWEKFPAALSATSVQSMSIYGQGLREGFLSAIDAAEAAVAATIGELKPILARDYPRLSARDGAQEAENNAVAAIRALKESK